MGTSAWIALLITWGIAGAFRPLNQTELPNSALSDAVFAPGALQDGDPHCPAQGGRLLAVIPSYGTYQRHHLKEVLRHLGDIARQGLEVHAVLLLTVPWLDPPKSPGLTVHALLFKPSIKHKLAGEWRRIWIQGLLAPAFDLFLCLEDDIAFTGRNLKALCAEMPHIHPQKYYPGLLRYETLTGRPPYFLMDMSYCCPQIGAVISLNGRAYVQPSNPYQALLLLPSGVLTKLVRGLGRDGLQTWLDYQSDHREHFMGLWFHNSHLIKVVPLNTVADHLVRHLSARHTRDVRGRIKARNLTTVAQVSRAINHSLDFLRDVEALPTVGALLSAARAPRYWYGRTPALPPLRNPTEYAAALLQQP